MFTRKHSKVKIYVCFYAILNLVFLFWVQDSFSFAPHNDKPETISKISINRGLESASGRVSVRIINDLLKSKGFIDDSASYGKNIAINYVKAMRKQIEQQIGGSNSEFILEKVQTDHVGGTHIRLRQTYKGIPVIGGEIIVHLDETGNVRTTSGKFAPDLDVSVVPKISEKEALNIIFDEFGVSTSKKLIQKPYIAILGGVLVYHFVVEETNAVLYHWYCYIDAITGEILLKYDNIQYAFPDANEGSPAGVGGYRLTGEGGSYISMWGWYNDPVLIPGELQEGIYFLFNFWNSWGIYDSNSGQWSQLSTYDWTFSDPAAVSAGANFEVTQEYVATVLGLNSFNNQYGLARGNVHFNVYDINNANWDGTAFYFGDGDGYTANALTTLDIVAHEYGHAITQYTSKLQPVPSEESAALNESYSDILGALVEFYAQNDGRDLYPTSSPGEADWLIGEDSWLIREALRDMKDPQRFAQPSYYEGTYWDTGSGNIHINSGVQNFTFYLLAEGSGVGINDGYAHGPITGLGIEVAGAIAMHANMKILSPTSDYQDSMEAWIEAADFLGYDPATVYAAWSATTPFLPPPGYEIPYIPVASLDKSSYSIFLGNSVLFDASQSFDPNGDPLTYYLNLGDGAVQVNLGDTSATFEHIYIKRGTYNVSLTVSDPDDNSDTATATSYVYGFEVLIPAIFMLF